MTTALPQNPFPGMNPYLESPGLWPGAHAVIIGSMQRFLNGRLRPHYVASIGERVYISGEPDGNGRGRHRIPDVAVLEERFAGLRRPAGAGDFQPAERAPGAVAVQTPRAELTRQRYLEIIQMSGRKVIGIIELLSPTNKSYNRDDYLTKRTEILHSAIHLVEIDLLRAGQPMPVVGDVPDNPYRIMVSDARHAPDADLYAFDLRQIVPQFMMPLAEGGDGVSINLNAVLDDAYVAGSYDMLIDYRQDPEPPLSDDDRAWLDGLLRAQGLR